MTEARTVAVRCARSRMGQAEIVDLLASGHKPPGSWRTAEIFQQSIFAETQVVNADVFDVDALARAFAGSDAIFTAIRSPGTSPPP